MAKCKNCGAELQPGAAFCEYCGTKVKIDVPAPAPSEPDLPDEEEEEWDDEEELEEETETAAKTVQKPEEKAEEIAVIKSSVDLRRWDGSVITAPVGFSWTTLFFGGLVALFRKDWKMFFIWFAVHAVLYYFIYSDPTFDETDSTLLAWAVNLFFAFKFNKWYIRKLLSKGWQPISKSDVLTLRSKKIIV